MEGRIKRLEREWNHPAHPWPNLEAGGPLGQLVDRSKPGGIPCQGRGPGVPDPLPVYRSDSNNSRPEQVGTLLIRRLDAPLDANR